VCVSYLAHAELWTIPCYPAANSGTAILSIEDSIAADGPMVAAVLAALDVPTRLLSNDVGDDEKASAVLGWLRRNRIPRLGAGPLSALTPRITVVADKDETRTWFVHLPHVVEQMTRLDLAALRDAAYVYVDCYELIAEPALRVVHAAQLAGVPLFVNLGGGVLSTELADALRHMSHVVVQTSIDDQEHDHALALARDLLVSTDAEWVIVTAGAGGAVAVDRLEELTMPAFQATVRHTHCAGAAFSGGLLYGLLHDWPMRGSLELAAASGALRCERAHDWPMPTLAELRTVIGERGRLPHQPYTEKGVPAAMYPSATRQ
jgi:sugar/nucleoside kinase (ribokinase family)